MEVEVEGLCNMAICSLQGNKPLLRQYMVDLKCFIKIQSG